MTLRQIKAVYYGTNGTGRRKVIKTNVGWRPRTMVLHSLDHLQRDEYGANVCEVFDASVGTLHAVLKRTAMKVEVIYRRDPKLARFA